MNINVATARFRDAVVIPHRHHSPAPYHVEFVKDVTEGVNCKSLYITDTILVIVYEDQAPTYVPLANVIQADPQIRK